jgi:hypothetical protein
MRNISRTLLAGIVVALVGMQAEAIVSDNGAFEAIPNRNVFGLKPPQQAIITNLPVALPKLILQGITTILGNKRVLLREEPAAQAGPRMLPPTEARSLILTEGQADGDVEVLQIDENAGSVMVKNSGTLMTLTFEKDGPKLPNTPPGQNPGTPPTQNPVGTPGYRGPAPQVPVPLLPGNSALSPTGRTDSGVGTYPRRAVRWPLNASPPSAQSAAAAPPTANDIPAGLTPEEQAIVQGLRSASQPRNYLAPSPTSPGVPSPLLPQ